MEKFISITKAKQDVEELTTYIELWETYQPVSVEQQIIKEYALLSSMEGVKERLNLRGCTIEGRPLEIDDIRAVITQKPKDKLHKIIHRGYKRKIRSNTY